MNRISQVPITPNCPDFRLLDRAALDALMRLQERIVFLRGRTSWIGFSQTAIEFEAAQRPAGTSKYSMTRMMVLALRGLLSFSTAPLRIGVWAGCLLFGASWLYGLWAIWAKFIAHVAVPGWTSTIWMIMLASSIQLIVLGIMAEYLAQIYEETKGRPWYFIRENVGFPDTEASNEGTANT